MDTYNGIYKTRRELLINDSGSLQQRALEHDRLRLAKRSRRDIYQRNHRGNRGMEREEAFMIGGRMASGRQAVRNVRAAALGFLVGALSLTSTIPFVSAEDAPLSVILQHKPTETHQLPQAGTLMPLSVFIMNSSDVDVKIRLVGSRDGRFMDIAFPMGVLNETDRPTYTINIPAPVAAMTYQFVVHQKSGELTLTDKYLIKRNCVQNFKVEVPETIPSAEYRKEIATLVAKARSLERDTRNLDTAIKLLDALKKDIPE